jgi:hypothetical protein
LRFAPELAPRVHRYASAPPPTIQGHARTSSLLVVAAARDQEQTEQPGAYENRPAEPGEEALAGLVRDLSNRMRRARDQIDALTRGVFDRLRNVRDAVLDRFLR